MFAITRLLEAFNSQIWAILPEKLALIREVLEMRLRGESFTEEQVRIRVEEGNPNKRDPQQEPQLFEITNVSAAVEAGVISAGPPTRSTAGKVAVLPVFGTLVQRLPPGSSRGTGVETISRNFDKLMADNGVRAIVLHVDSPGGSAFGLAEFSKKIFDARGEKKIVAVADSLMASAAYYIGSSASEVAVTPGGLVGSIGVISSHIDASEADKRFGYKTTIISAGKYKAEGNSYEPLTDEARESIQTMVNDYYDQFVSAVARNRNTTPAAVRGGYGEGRVLIDKKAVEAGLADRISTLEQVLARLGVPAGSSPINAEGTETSVPSATSPAGKNEFSTAIATKNIDVEHRKRKISIKENLKTRIAAQEKSG